MRAVAFYPIHYGKEYLEASIKVIDPFVEEILILYSSNPSYGFNANIICPETRDSIKEVAEKASLKIRWYDIDANNEGAHRELAFRFIRDKGYDVLISCDADEVWDPIDLERCIRETAQSNIWRRNVNGFINFWKSFNMACYDGFQPARLFNLKATNKLEQTIDGKIYHFGCAQDKSIMNYKYEVHGHKKEIRPNWLEKVYHSWSDCDTFLHPVSLQIWEKAIPFDKKLLPEVLRNHINYNKVII